jgi:two-component system response regulator
MRTPVVHESKEVDILLVDGDAKHAASTTRAFKQHGLSGRVFALEDGQEALEFIFAEGRYADREADPPPKIVLLDLKAPHVEGLRILKEVKGERRLKGVCIIVMAASPHDSELKEAYALGADSFVAKPLKFEAFVNALSECGVYWPTLKKPKK